MLNNILVMLRSWLYMPLVVEKSPLYVGVHLTIETTAPTRVPRVPCFPL